MKTHQLSAIVVATGFMIQAVAAYDIQISTNSFGILFEDASISEGLKAFIVADVQRCYDAWGTNVVMHTSQASTHVLRAYPSVFAWPYYDGKGRPEDDVNVPRNITTNQYGQMMLKVSPRLIQKYAEACVFKTNHLAQVQAADAFVDFVSSSAFAGVSSNLMSNYFLVKDATPQMYLDSAEDLVTGIGRQEFYLPSILGFTYRDRGPGGTNLWVFIPTALKKKGAFWSYDVLPAIWHDGKWKFSFWDAQE